MRMIISMFVMLLFGVCLASAFTLDTVKGKGCTQKVLQYDGKEALDYEIHLSPETCEVQLEYIGKGEAPPTLSAEDEKGEAFVSFKTIGQTGKDAYTFKDEPYIKVGNFTIKIISEENKVVQDFFDADHINWTLECQGVQQNAIFIQGKENGMGFGANVSVSQATPCRYVGEATRDDHQRSGTSYRYVDAVTQSRDRIHTVDFADAGESVVLHDNLTVTFDCIYDPILEMCVIDPIVSEAVSNVGYFNQTRYVPSLSAIIMGDLSVWANTTGFNCSGQWDACTSAFDGDTTTFAFINSLVDQYDTDRFYINFTNPPGFINGSYLNRWHEGGAGNAFNVTIPFDCLQSTILEVLVQGEYNDGYDNMTCFTGVEWVNFSTRTGLNPDGIEIYDIFMTYMVNQSEGNFIPRVFNLTANASRQFAHNFTVELDLDRNLTIIPYGADIPYYDPDEVIYQTFIIGADDAMDYSGHLSITFDDADGNLEQEGMGIRFDGVDGGSGDRIFTTETEEFNSIKEGQGFSVFADLIFHEYQNTHTIMRPENIFSLDIRSGGIRLLVWAGGAQTCLQAGTDDASVDVRHRIMAIKNESNNRSLLYVDGVLVENDACAFTLDDASSFFGIGSDSGASELNGTLYMGMIFNRSLTDAEAKNWTGTNYSFKQGAEHNHDGSGFYDLSSEPVVQNITHAVIDIRFNEEDALHNFSLGYDYFPVAITADTSGPNITLGSPANNNQNLTEDLYEWAQVEFHYTSTDAGTCYLIINDTRNQTSTGIADTEVIVNTNLTLGDYEWSINCSDAAGNENNSAVRDITIIDGTPPSCTLISRTPIDIEANSSGNFTLKVNCTDLSGINTTKAGEHWRAFFTMTVDSNQSLPNHCSIFYPPNNLAQSDNPLTRNILRAVGRNESYWYEDEGLTELDQNIFDYAVYDGEYGHFMIFDSGPTWAAYNITGPLEHLVFQMAFPLNKQSMMEEVKIDYEIDFNDGLMLITEDLEAMKGTVNYTMVLWANINRTAQAPNKDLAVYYCNETYLFESCATSFLTGCSVKPQDDSEFCVSLGTYDEIEVLSKGFCEDESCYVGPKRYGVSNRKLGGVGVTNKSFFYFRSLTPLGSYTMRYATGLSGTDIAFADTQYAFKTTTDGATYTYLNGHPDVHLNYIATGDQLKIGGCTWDLSPQENRYCNFTWITDPIGDVNFKISNPNIAWINSSGGGLDENLNGTHNTPVGIHILMARDPNAPGTVNNTLALHNPDGSFNVTLNETFNSTDDSDITLYIPTIVDGIYRLNVTARALDNPSDIQSFLSESNFTVDNTEPAITLNRPLEEYNDTLQNILFNCSALDNYKVVNLSFWITDGLNASFALDTTVSWPGGTLNSLATIETLNNGNYTWNCQGCDAMNNCNWTDNRSLLVNVSNPDILPPYVILNGPANGAVVSGNNVTPSCTAWDNQSNIASVQLWGNWSGAWAGNVTNSTTSELNNSAVYFPIELPEGDYLWNCRGVDAASQSGFAANNWTFRLTFPTFNFNLSAGIEWIKARW